ncbi:MAG: putative membrane protein insertion efficiency factor [Myxococcota bacterium]|jgi:putative membrane protein insertion efficiency factor
MISYYTPPVCRFHPTCSQYAVTALRVYGPVRGTAMASWRILRCNPFHPGGYDPVPQEHHQPGEALHTEDAPLLVPDLSQEQPDSMSGDKVG